MKIVISAESTIDLPQELLDKYDIHVIPFNVILGETVYLDGVITPQQIFDYVDDTRVLPRTSAINAYTYKEYFEGLLKDYDAVVHLALSEKISSSINNAREAAGELQNVRIVDSKSLSTGIALSAIYACDLVKQGLSLDEVVEKLEKRIPSVQASFVVNTLAYLYKGGRCSALELFGASILRLKPQILLKDGAMIPGKKFMGKSLGCVNDYCDATLDEFDNPDKSIVFITHSCASKDMVDAARAKLEARGFKNIIETTAGATITSHCGPKTLGILYINDGGVTE